MEQPPVVPLPRTPDDPENLRRLREDAHTRLSREEEAAGLPPMPRPEPQSGPTPAPVYGGPPVPQPRSIGKLLLVVGIALAGVVILWLFFDQVLSVRGILRGMQN